MTLLTLITKFDWCYLLLAPYNYQMLNVIISVICTGLIFYTEVVKY